ncbi:hypothetical protein BV898_19199 [Hypsibius exemplaris]|uniref:Uncharacterized protein n=1 Tax=Hypsibius exemplaris TaxID=2072580 RepID=A0A9X6NIU7_HYPEX|nr:hypothetical protein BV898_19199 [Hypsibius exemplaris]
MEYSAGKKERLEAILAIPVSGSPVTQSGVLSALCSPLHGALNPTSINLNEAIANVDGVLDVNLKKCK